MHNPSVAVVFFGHLRTYKSCIHSIKENIVEPLNASVYIHSWDELESNTTTWHTEKTKNRKVDSKDINLLNEVLAPKALVIESQAEYLRSNQRDVDSNHLGIKSMFYSKASAIKLAEGYDIVITIRPDIYVGYKMSYLDITQKGLIVFYNTSNNNNDLKSVRAVDIVNISSWKTLNNLGEFFLNNFNAFVVPRLSKSGGEMLSDYCELVGLNYKLSKFKYGNNWFIFRSGIKSRITKLKMLAKKYVFEEYIVPICFKN
ncbi:hypothetical protein ABWJ16_002006 [Vibrio alginolyticus]